MSSHTDILLVGHCGADEAMLSHALHKIAPASQVVSIANHADAEAAGADTLLLINRVLDGRFDATSGVELIRHLAGRPDAPTMMLVSNYEDAQREAVEAGAALGFGKARIHETATAQMLREALEGS